MLFSKQSLAVRHAASTDKADPALHRVQLEHDGSAVAADVNAGGAKMVLAVSPVDPERAEYFPPNDEPNVDPPAGGVGVPPSMAATVVGGMPTGKHPALQFAQLTRCDRTGVELYTTNGVTGTKRSAPPARRPFPKWRGLLAAARTAATRGRVCVDRRALIRLLQAMERACPDPGNYSPVWIEFGGEEDAICLRGENSTAKQVAVGIVTPLRVTGEWPEETEWEANLGAQDQPLAEPVARRGPRRVPRVRVPARKTPRRVG